MEFEIGFMKHNCNTFLCARSKQIFLWKLSFIWEILIFTFLLNFLYCVFVSKWSIYRLNTSCLSWQMRKEIPKERRILPDDEWNHSSPPAVPSTRGVGATAMSALTTSTSAQRCNLAGTPVGSLSVLDGGNGFSI